MNKSNVKYRIVYNVIMQTDNQKLKQIMPDDIR